MTKVMAAVTLLLALGGCAGLSSDAERSSRPGQGVPAEPNTRTGLLQKQAYVVQTDRVAIGGSGFDPVEGLTDVGVCRAYLGISAEVSLTVRGPVLIQVVDEETDEPLEPGPVKVGKSSGVSSTSYSFFSREFQEPTTTSFGLEARPAGKSAALVKGSLSVSYGQREDDSTSCG